MQVGHSLCERLPANACATAEAPFEVLMDLLAALKASMRPYATRICALCMAQLDSPWCAVAPPLRSLPSQPLAATPCGTTPRAVLRFLNAHKGPRPPLHFCSRYDTESSEPLD
jgi:hypothetical protein